MNTRDLIDRTRASYVNSSSAPIRAIVYVRSSDDLEISLNSFVKDVEFNQDEKGAGKASRISCRALILEKKPTKLDTIVYDGETYKVKTWRKRGNSYVVEADIRQVKVSSRSTK